MKNLIPIALFIFALLFVSGCGSNPSEKLLVTPPIRKPLDKREESTVPNQFQSIWDEVNSDPLERLPQNKVSYGQLFDGAKDIIFEDASRTLVEHSDIREYYDKLAHPNGVCLKGIWEIDTQNPYSGYFKQGSKALIIARASSALSETKKGDTRAFGLAGKLFATLDPLKTNSENSANFFVIDDLGGTDAEQFTDVTLTNEPKVSFTLAVVKYFLYAAKVSKVFGEVDTNPGIRQLYEISYMGESNTSSAKTPKWMKIELAPHQTLVNGVDFREEFLFDENRRTLAFTISVANSELDGSKVWQEIGTITFDASVVSTTCDHRLHFHHPKFVALPYSGISVN